MTFIEEFYNTAIDNDFVKRRSVYPSDLKKVSGSIAGKVFGVLLVLDIHTDFVHLVRIYRRKGRGWWDKDMRDRSGYASKALRCLCRWADKYCFELRLNVVPFGHCTMTEEELRSWYERNGFVGKGVWMVRKPRH